MAFVEHVRASLQTVGPLLFDLLDRKLVNLPRLRLFLLQHTIFQTRTAA